MVIYSPLIGNTLKIGGTDTSVDTALPTTDSCTYNCLKLEAVTNLFHYRLGPAGGTAVVDTDAFITTTAPHFVSVSPATQTNIQCTGAAGSLYVTPCMVSKV